MSKDIKRREEFCQNIINTLIAHPDWAPDVVAATNKGFLLAFEELENKTIKYRKAITSALTLGMAKAGIKNPYIKDACTKDVLDAMNGDSNSCKIDKDYIKAFLKETLTAEEIESILIEMRQPV